MRRWFGRVALAAALAGCTGPTELDDARDLHQILGAEAEADAGFLKADRVRVFEFPRDHGSHPRYRSEWWYLTAVVATIDGREFGVQFTLFRQGLEARDPYAVEAVGPAAWRTAQGYMAHVAVSDVARGRHHHAERFARGHPALAGVAAAPFRAYLEDWQMASLGSGFWPQRLSAKTAGFRIDLELAGSRPAILQGDAGLSRKGPGNASYYYSIPRIAARGELALGGEVHAVAGLAWIDREWSTSVLSASYAGWDWFALHLDDGRDLMLYRLRRIDGATDPFNSGSLGDGTTSRTLAAGDFMLEPIEHWRGWPVAWRSGSSPARNGSRSAPRSPTR